MRKFAEYSACIYVIWFSVNDEALNRYLDVPITGNVLHLRHLNFPAVAPSKVVFLQRFSVPLGYRLELQLQQVEFASGMLSHFLEIIRTLTNSDASFPHYTWFRKLWGTVMRISVATFRRSTTLTAVNSWTIRNIPFIACVSDDSWENRLKYEIEYKLFFSGQWKLNRLFWDDLRHSEKRLD